MIIVWRPGFIGNNIVQGLNARGISDILVVDDLTDGRKCLEPVGRPYPRLLDRTVSGPHPGGESFGEVRRCSTRAPCSAAKGGTDGS